MNHKRYFAPALVLTMCLTILTGCSRRNDTVTDPTAQPTDTPTSQEEVAGLINYVSDQSIAISVYTAEGDLTDLSSIDTADWTAMDTTRYLPVDDSTEYYRMEGSHRATISKADLAVGDFIIATTANGVQQITRVDERRADESANEAVPTAIPSPMNEEQAEDKQT